MPQGYKCLKITSALRLQVPQGYKCLKVTSASRLQAPQGYKCLKFASALRLQVPKNWFSGRLPLTLVNFFPQLKRSRKKKRRKSQKKKKSQVKNTDNEIPYIQTESLFYSVNNYWYSFKTEAIFTNFFLVRPLPAIDQFRRKQRQIKQSSTKNQYNKKLK